MANCKTCGAKLGWASDCNPCKEKAAAAKEEALRAEEQARFEKWAKPHVQRIDATLAAGRPVYLSETTYIHVNSHVEGMAEPWPLSFGELRAWGYEGWHVVGVVPRTFGTYIQQPTGDGGSYATAGMGGNVSGAYVLLELRVDPEHAAGWRPAIVAHLRRRYAAEGQAS